MVRIRLRRIGAKHQPAYRFVAADKEDPRDGRFLEILGDYNPRTEPPTVRVKEDRIYHWLSVGAQPSESALQVLNLIGFTERYERYKKGESIETLLEESKQAQLAQNIDARTRRDDIVKQAAPKEKTEEASEEE
ncbi:MAG: 30S ribosomal protein S16 [Anaerolinea sp. 4484_236]|nr:MAG: 30S ribosomal protein S16 [Anaerolinea sp. 4484_236]OQY37262.1 MAG: 30S ribosomal protein S16 [Anaerolineaceae bacterium 4572_5.2]